ncbi:leucine rich repeat (LRR) protein [Cupriavidus gilardii J11]|uniref:Leucine rich repeat (LRR) protein n=1 Tax=Cupriavidus gilardii J11 TaxID=936133 RepID=A0A562BRZ2_9BURK|nr:leucine-rich repeat domain-containing protein [Cupriavidus gilardii]TWG87533.1 leucine rich repeat (LRR) protein [Cupriavidus gilardii J11]
MPIAELSLESVAQFKHYAASRDGVQQLCRAGTFRFKARCYRLLYPDSGPTIAREGPARVLADFFTHRLAQGSLSSYADQLTRHLRASREAVLACMAAALEDWQSTQQDSRCVEASDRILACYARHGSDLDLRRLGMTTVPPVLGWLRNITALRLSGNALSEVPPVVAKLTGLQVLELDHNQISEVPRWLDRLKALQVLSLSDNKLTAWPDVIGRLPKLAFVWLENNGIPELWPGAEFLPPHFEVFMRGNPFTRNAISDAFSGLGGPCRRSPLHHEVLDSIPPCRGDHAPSARWQLGRLAVLIHGAPGGAGPALPTLGGTGLPSELQGDCERLFAEIQDCLTSLEKTREPPMVYPRLSHIMGYRLDLLRRVLCTDAELYRSHAGALRSAARWCAFALLRALDDAELTLAQMLVERSNVPPDVVATLGQGVFRMALLKEVIQHVWSTATPSPVLEQVVQNDMASHLMLPIEVRPLFFSSWDEDIFYNKGSAQRVLDGVLQRESADDFRRLDDFMADWKPWQALVRRSCGPAVAQAEEFLAGLLAAVDAPVPDTGEPPPDAATRRDAIVRAYEQVIRDFCRDGFRAWRRGGEPGFAAWCRQGGPQVAAAPAVASA